MVNIKTIGFLSLLILSLSFYSYSLYQKAEALKTEVTFKEAENVSLRASNETSLKAIVTLNERIISSQRASQELTEDNLRLTLEYNKTKKDLESHIGRLDKAFEGKPELMNKLVNKSFDKFIDQVSCNSGDKKSCKN